MMARRAPNGAPADHCPEGPVAAKVRFINPENLVRSSAYTQVVEVMAPCRTIYVSGQLATTRDGKLAGDDFPAQAEQVFRNLKAALAAAGANFADVVKIESYLKDIAHLPILREVRARHLNLAALPASTTIAVSGFAVGGALLEVEVIAVVPRPAARSRLPKPAARGKVKSARRTGR
jgi:enamine deaminase RidA (YjgF/YER057c/UK114 family)